MHSWDEREEQHGGEMTTLFHENSKVRNWIWKREKKREIHEYWVLLLSTLRVHHTLDLPLFRDPQQIRSSRKKVPMDSESKDPETELAFQETKETEVVIVSPE